MSASHHGIEVAHGAYTQNLLPAVVLANDLKHLCLLGHFLQAAGILSVGNAQEQAVVEAYEVEQVNLSRVGEQATVHVVDGVVQPVIVGIQVVLALQQLHLAGHALFAKHLYRLLDGALDTVDGHVRMDDFLHTLADAGNV